MIQLAPIVAEPAPWRGMIQPALAPDRPLDEARALLERVMARPELIAGLPLVRTPLRYERNFLFGDEATSVWAMTWAAGSATAIHDHHCSCCFGIIAGELVERRFRSLDGDRAVQTFERSRGAGFIACMQPTGPNIHQMLNLSAEEAISIHVYGFDRRRRASSVDREYQACGVE
jgi:predicted metal-dependent enzyme (double-stranded beta helix superfamily)